MTQRDEVSLPQAGGGSGWGLFSPAIIESSGTAVAPTLTLPRLGGGNGDTRCMDHMQLPCPTRGVSSALHSRVLRCSPPACASTTGFAGRRTVMRVPFSSALSMVMAPPCFSTSERTIARPRPEPEVLRL
jgi:hypothetical protein